MKRDKFITWTIVSLIALIPIGMWLQPSSLSSRLANLPTTLVSIGQIAGLAGMSLFALTLFFSTRLKILEAIFGGLNKVFPAHHLLGKITFILLLIHPLVIAASILPYSAKEAIFFFIPGKNPSVDYGIASLFILTLLLVFTLFIRLPFHTWRNLHQFLGVAFVFAAFHVLRIESDVTPNKPLRYYMILVILVGLSAYLYRTVLKRFLVKKYLYIVNKLDWLSDDVVEITLFPKTEKMFFSAGQFVFVTFAQPRFSNEEHPFSIASQAGSAAVKIVVKVSGDYTGRLHELKKEAKAYLEGPYGKFSSTNHPEKEQLWLAGGIGITPFLSMTRSLTCHSPKINLIYSVSTEKEAIFVAEFQQLAKKNKRFRYLLWITKKQGRLNVESLQKLIKDLPDKEIFICGPIPMIKSLRAQFLQSGVAEENLHSEEFQLA